MLVADAIGRFVVESREPRELGVQRERSLCVTMA